MGEHDGERAGRARRWASRVKAAPSRLEWLFAHQESVDASLREGADALARLEDRLEDRLERIEARAANLGDDGRAGVTAVGDEIHRLRADIQLRLDVLDRSLTGYVQTLQTAVAAPGRDAERARLVADLGPSPPTTAGLSVFIICWNHGGFLATAIESALALLDGLDVDQQGEVLVLDDGSVDETPEVAVGLARADPRVRVVTARANIGLARARNVLLHTVGTRHAFQLDADNTATPEGVAALLRVAREYGSTFTYGNVLRHDGEGHIVGSMSNEPLAEAWFRGNYIDTMAVVDVYRLRALGGWPEDHAVEHVEDWAVVHRVARAGELIGFVPVVVGRYLAHEHGLHLSVSDTRIGLDRVARLFNADGRVGADSVAAFAAHPQLGPLWATAPAIARNATLAPSPPAAEAPSERPCLLLVGPGGVANLGDDAIVAAALDRLRHLLPDHDLDVVTDGPEPLALGPRALWVGPLLEVVRGLTDDDLADNLDADVDQAVSAAAIITGVGSLSHRSLEPGMYAGAVFLGGGSIMSLWTDTLIAPRTVLAAALRRAKVPYVVSGQGIGPLDERSRALASVVLEGAVRGSVRDAGSVGWWPASITAAAAAEVQVTGDDALMLAAADEATVSAALRRAGVDGAYLAVSVRRADYVGTSAEQLDGWADAVDHLAADRGLIVLGVALNHHPEHPEVVTLAGLARGAQARRARWRVLECASDPGLLAGVMSGAAAAVVHSYHAALFALRAGVPALLVASNEYYEQKAKGLADLAGLPDAFVLPRAVDRDDLATRLDRIAAALEAGPGLTPAEAAVETWWTTTIQTLVP